MKIYLSIIFFSLFVWPAHKTAEAEESYEKQIYHIYLKHYKYPVPHSEWTSKIQALPEKRKLKFKDNLWDLSGSLLQDPLYWSKIWAANPQAENPHLIYEGRFLKFDPLTLSQASASKYSANILSQFPGLALPPNESAKRALSVSEIPSSLPSLLDFRVLDNEIDISQIQPIEVKKQTLVPFYLTDSAPSIAGEIISKDGYGRSIGLGGESLIVQLDSEVSIGSVFTVFEDKGKIRRWLKSLIGSNGNEIMVKGRIKILAYLAGANSLYRAVVVDSMHKMQPGDFILSGASKVYNFSQKGPMGAGNGLIIGTPDKNQTLLSLGSIVYLDQGEDDGLRKGDFFYIQGAANKNNTFLRPYTYNRPLLGKLKIIHTAKDTSTGIIIEAKTHIFVGDSFSGDSSQLKDLDQSLDHEKVEEYEITDKGKELLIDVEEQPKESAEGPEDMEEIEDMEEAEDMEEIEDMEEAEDMEEIEDMEEAEGMKERDEELEEAFEEGKWEESLEDEGLEEELEEEDFGEDDRPKSELEEFERLDTL